MNKQDRFDHTLRYLAARGSLHQVESIIEKGANPSRCIKEIYPLTLAVRNNDYKVGEYLHSLYDDQRMVRDTIHLCIELDNYELFKCVYQKGVIDHRMVRNCILKAQYDMIRCMINNIDDWSSGLMMSNNLKCVLQHCPIDIINSVIDIIIKYNHLSLYSTSFLTESYNKENIRSMAKLVYGIYKNASFDIRYIYHNLKHNRYIAEIVTALINRPYFPSRQYLTENTNIFFKRYGSFYALCEEYPSDIIKYILMFALRYIE